MEEAKQEQQDQRPSPKRRKRLIVAGVVVVVVIAVAAGMLVWHEQPSFCGTLCHDVMGSYVEGYESDDDTLLVTSHASLDYSCLDCHEPTISSQLTELGAYISGNYTIPLEDSEIGTREFCTQAGCHDDFDEVVEATSDWSGTVTVYNTEGIYNPHDNHRGNENCSSCHSMHGQSTLYCVECHTMEVPDGWLGFE